MLPRDLGHLYVLGHKTQWQLTLGKLTVKFDSLFLPSAKCRPLVLGDPTILACAALSSQCACARDELLANYAPFAYNNFASGLSSLAAHLPFDSSPACAFHLR